TKCDVLDTAIRQRFVAGTTHLILHSRFIKFPSVRLQFGLARMDRYRLFVYSHDGRPLGSAIVIHAADDAEAIAQAEGMRGSFPAELLDVEGLRIVKYLNGRTPSPNLALASQPIPLAAVVLVVPNGIAKLPQRRRQDCFRLGRCKRFPGIPRLSMAAGGGALALPSPTR